MLYNNYTINNSHSVTVCTLLIIKSKCCINYCRNTKNVVAQQCHQCDHRVALSPSLWSSHSDSGAPWSCWSTGSCPLEEPLDTAADRKMHRKLTKTTLTKHDGMSCSIWQLPSSTRFESGCSSADRWCLLAGSWPSNYYWRTTRPILSCTGEENQRMGKFKSFSIKTGQSST